MPEGRVRADEGPQMGEAHVLFISHQPAVVCLMNELSSIGMPKAGLTTMPEMLESFSDSPARHGNIS